MHPPHGETANHKWSFDAITRSKAGRALHLKMNLHLQKGSVSKPLAIVNGENVVYARHRIRVLSGPMTFSHHDTLKFPDHPGSGRLSFSKHRHATTYYEQLESPEMGTYSILKPNSVITDFRKVPLVDGTTTDLSAYPNRQGFEDLAMVCADPNLDFAWSAVTFAKERYVWFNIKDPRILASTVLWITNGGRWSPPWNGRHINAMGVEEGTTYWGNLHVSARTNDLARRGIKTAHRFSATKPYDVPLIMGVAKVPRGFNKVKDIRRFDDHTISLIGNARFRVEVPMQIGFLETATLKNLIEA